MNGTPDPTKHHPLRSAAISDLRWLSLGAVECYRINPGVSNRLGREGLIEQTTFWVLGSPRRMWRITDAGRARLAELDREE